MNLLFDLSTSHYSKVRICAQNILSKMCKWFAYSYKLIVPKVSSSKSKKVTRTWRCLFLKAPRICFSCRYGFKVLMAILLIIFIVPTKSNSGFIEVRVGWTISWYLLLYHQDQFRIKSGSGDQNKQIIPSAETLGWTATENLCLNNIFFLWDPTSYNSGRGDVNIRVHSVLPKPALISPKNHTYRTVHIHYTQLVLIPWNEG